jgi:hypothetical protein
VAAPARRQAASARATASLVAPTSGGVVARQPPSFAHDRGADQAGRAGEEGAPVDDRLSGSLGTVVHPRRLGHNHDERREDS